MIFASLWSEPMTAARWLESQYENRRLRCRHAGFFRIFRYGVIAGGAFTAMHRCDPPMTPTQRRAWQVPMRAAPVAQERQASQPKDPPEWPRIGGVMLAHVSRSPDIWIKQMFLRRIGAFANLLFAALERAALKNRLDEIGNDTPALAGRP